MRVLRYGATGWLMGLFVVLVCGWGSAQAAAPGAGLTIDSFAMPTNFAAGMEGGYEVTVTSAGSVATKASEEIVVADTLPAGVTAQRIDFIWEGPEINIGAFLCDVPTVKCRFPGKLGPDETLTMIVHVTVGSSAPEHLVNSARVTGGGAPEAEVEKANTVSSSPAPFGPSNFDLHISGMDGARDTQAGDHPYAMVTTIGLDNAVRQNGPQGLEVDTSVQDLKDVVVDLPLGFVGSTLATPQCALIQLSASSKCPADTVVGHIHSEPLGTTSADSPIYNVVPEQGVPAEFGFVDVLGVSHVFYVQVVPSAGGYVLQATNSDIPSVNLTRVVVEFYGDPAAKQEELALLEGKIASPIAPVPLFTNPTDCSGAPVTATIHMDSWQNPGTYTPEGTPNLTDGKWVSATSQSPPVTGCDGLQFPAEVGAQPTTHEADKPSGMDFEIKVPQSETMGAPGTPAMKKAIVTLPEGFTVDPSAGDGLASCSEAQIGWLGGTPLNFNAAPPRCPEASKIGSLELETPLIAHKFEGEMFLASQNENPFNTTLAAYVVVHDPMTGVLVKIAGKVLPDPHTGQLTAVFDEIPNVPFSDVKLHFFGGPRAEFATPESCGTFTTTTELFPYSAPDSGPPSTPFDSFVIDEACPGGFGPTFTASSLNLQAGAYTPFVASFGRSDTDQELAGLTVTLPAGLLAKVAGVPLCSDAQIGQAEAGTGGCPDASQVGTVKTGVGPGPNPLFVSGKAYLTGPYNGGPYGLAVVVPAVAGPFNFGTVVVRQSIRIDPRTARVTDVSDPFPTIIDGIPLRLRRVDLMLDRPQFTFNPTSCEHETFTGSISGSPLGAPRRLNHTGVGYATQSGATAPISAPFQVTDCAGLKFTPHFEASTKARPSRANGASLTVKLSYPSAPWGTEANVGKVKVSLPKQLPSRLKTLQKACTASQFNANPAACPAASIVGHAIVHTPVLPLPLQGPAYFVSNGGQAFPNLIMVLQGNNVTVQLLGDTFISKKGITSSTFNNVPDVPFSSFQLTLPQGPYSALAADLPGKAKGKFCGQKLKMPTILDAQNGMVFKQTTKIAVAGCRKGVRRASRKAHRATAEHRSGRR